MRFGMVTTVVFPRERVKSGQKAAPCESQPDTESGRKADNDNHGVEASDRGLESSLETVRVAGDYGYQVGHWMDLGALGSGEVSGKQLQRSSLGVRAVQKHANGVSMHDTLVGWRLVIWLRLRQASMRSPYVADHRVLRTIGRKGEDSEDVGTLQMNFASSGQCNSCLDLKIDCALSRGVILGSGHIGHHLT